MVEEYAAVEESNTLPISGPMPATKDALTDILRRGARRLLAEAVEAEVAAWIESHAHLKDEAGRRQVVRNGHLPERAIQTGLGDLDVKQPRVHDRRPGDRREHFTSAILPPYLRRTRSLEESIPSLYLKGGSTGDFSEALGAILGPDAPWPSPEGAPPGPFPRAPGGIPRPRPPGAPAPPDPPPQGHLGGRI